MTFDKLVLCALRYSLERKTDIVDEMTSYIMLVFFLLHPSTRHNIIQEIETAINRGKIKDEEYKEKWQKVLYFIEE